MRTENQVLRVPWGETIETAISLQNTSELTVSCRARATTCACLSIGRDQDVLRLAPGEVGQVVLEVEGTTRGVRSEKLMLVVESGAGPPATEFVSVQVWTGDALFLDAPSLSFSGERGAVLPRATLVSIVLSSAQVPPALQWETRSELDFELESVITTHEGELEIARYSLAARLPSSAVGSNTTPVAFWFGDKERLTLNASVLTW